MEFPKYWIADVLLNDGQTARLRPITVTDRNLLTSFYEQISDTSKYLRFFSPMPKLGERQLTHFTDIDYQNRVAFVMTLAEQIIAVGRFDVTSTATIGEPKTAEVAFLVTDEHQGRGIGTLLLEHLAQAGRDRGVAKFLADVLPQNQSMIQMLHEAGYRTTKKISDGIMQFEFYIDQTPTSFGALEDREHRAEAASIEAFFNAKSIAVIGASRKQDTIGQALVRHLVTGDYTGRVYAVNPTAAAVAGLPAYPNIQDIPDQVDVAVVAVPADAVTDVVLDCAAKGVHGLIVVSSGFAESGAEGRERQRKLLGLARSYGLRLIGPNCLGLINTAPEISMNASLSRTMPQRGRAGFFCQSGALGSAILEEANERGLGISTFVSAGNRADVSGNDLLQYWEEDNETEVILLYLESIGNPRKFSRIARRVSRVKPIIAVRSGRSTQGVPMGHAVRSIAAPQAAVDAMFAQAGIIQVDTLDEMFDVAQLAAHQPLPAGNKVAIVGNSDAIALLAADAADAQGLEVTRQIALGTEATGPDFELAIDAAIDAENVDAVMVVYVPPLNTSGVEVAQVLAAVGEQSEKPLLSTFLASEGIPELLRVPSHTGHVAGRGSVPSYSAVEAAVRALSRLAAYAAWRSHLEPESSSSRVTAKQDAHKMVAQALVGNPNGRKLSQTEISNILDQYQIITGAIGKPKPTDSVGVNVAIGANEDPLFGPIVSFSIAGKMTELIGDISYRIPPISHRNAAEMIRQVKAAPVLFGYQGSTPVDVESLEELITKISELKQDLPQLSLSFSEVEVNPNGVLVRSVSGQVAPVAMAGLDRLTRRMNSGAFDTGIE